MTIESWTKIVKQKQAEVATQIPPAWRLPAEYTDISQTKSTNVLDVPRRCGLLSPKQLEITEKYDATALLEKIHHQELSAYEVTEAFCIRAAIAQQVTHCLTEMFFDRALQRAKQLDEEMQRTGTPIGPLHGLPISFKDCFNIQGIPSSIGFTSFIKNGPVKSNSAMVQVLLELGAVPFVKTNIPQTMMAADSHNNVFGRTLNPHRSNLNAGGSSGGEGALIAMRGSVLGIGTDIAGSIRIPAICNGIFALRPSADRIPYGGQTSSARGGLAGIKACAGPLATSVRDLELLMRVVANADPWQADSSVIFAPWRSVAPKSTLRLGLIQEDPHFPLHPPVLRTLTQAADKLRAAGHEVVLLTTPSIRDACALAFRMFSMDPAKTPFKHIAASGEPIIPALASTTLPHEYMQYDPAPMTLQALYDLNEERQRFKEAFRSLIVEANVDAIIMPGYQGTAQPHDLFGFVPYTVLWNLMDYPGCIIPYGKADKGLDAAFSRDDVEYKPPYTADAVEGAPCCVQVVGRNMREEELLVVASTVSRVLAE
ncbi:Amidase [Penicillium riverlandense]|uniref:Amidase n=1 Tax=Penicillium riverlandense TaxID=1903569 RepID=UPI00254679F3|nr:Amidase [Penicillium riverlandense]KAJ5805347.1 Amidase [Penicillium riverlandense]